MSDYRRVWRYTIDLDAPLYVDGAKGVIMQGNVEADALELTLTRGGRAVPLNGLQSALAMVTNLNGETIRNPGSIDNAITIPLMAESYAVPGKVKIEVLITTSEGITRTLMALSGYVEPNHQGVVIDPSGEIPSYEDLAAIMARLEQALETVGGATNAANTAATAANTAAGSASTAAGNATTAAGSANNAASRADAAAAAIEGITASATELAPGAAPTASVTDANGHKHLTLGIPPGAKGDPGDTPELSIGTVTTGEPGTDASATMTGTAEAPVLNLTIPRGTPGEGAVSAVDGVQPDTAGNVQLNAVRTVDGVSPGAGGAVELSALRYNAPMELTDEQKQNVQMSIGLDQFEASPEVHIGPEPPTGDEVLWVDTDDEGGTDGPQAPVFLPNLLDNPDFAIAQAGYGGSHGSQAYAADRWKLTSGTVSYTEESGLTLNGTMEQIMETVPDGAVSVFVTMTSGTATASYSNGVVTVTSSGGVIGHVEAYEGEYTEAAKPTYTKPDKALELLKCMRIFFRLNTNYSLYGNMWWSNGITSAEFGTAFWINIPVRQRVVPAVKLNGNFFVTSGNGDKTLAGIFAINQMEGGVCLNAVPDTMITPKTAVGLIADGTDSYIDFIADL